MKKQVNKEKSLKIGLKESAVSSIQSNIEATFIPQFALALKGTSFHVSLLSAFSSLISPLAQLKGDKLLEKYSRKKILLSFLTLQILLFLIIAFLGLLFYKNFFQDSLIYALLILYSLFWLCHGLLYPAWFSWLGDLTSKNNRGKYFSKRNNVITLVGTLLIPLGFVLDYFETRGLLLIGFFALFILGVIGKTLSLYFMAKIYEPKLKLKKNYYFSFSAFLKKFDSVGKFSVYYALFNLALMIASPFFAVYMKQELQFNYLEITIISLSSSIFYMLFSPLMGKISDKYGNIKLLYVSCLLLSFNPILWIFLKDVVSLSLVTQLLVGISNAALSISVVNFIYNKASKEHRALCVSYLNILVGIAAFVGALLGGLLVSIIPASFISPFIAVFAISGVARLFISIFFIRKIRETEKVKHLPSVKLDILHPVRTIHSELSLMKKLAHA